MDKKIFVYEKEPECTGCVIGAWCEDWTQVDAVIDAGEERIHTACEDFAEFGMYRGYRVIKIGQVD